MADAIAMSSKTASKIETIRLRCRICRATIPTVLVAGIRVNASSVAKLVDYRVRNIIQERVNPPQTYDFAGEIDASESATEGEWA